MRLLYLTDRLSSAGGADHHLLDLIRGAAERPEIDAVAVACGRVEPGAPALGSVEVTRVRGLARPGASAARLSGLAPLMAQFDVLHAQNVMNPFALRQIAATGRAAVTVQDHRVFCPYMGKVTPDGAACDAPMEPAICAGCFDDPERGRRMLALTRERLAALAGARLVVLSRYMARELAAVGRPGALVIPPWIAPGAPRTAPGRGFVLGGRLVAHKGAVGAWRAWRQSGTAQPLIVAGAGPLAGSLPGADQRGWLTRRTLRALLRSARALLFPARWQEPFGILGVEALAEGTPVIVAAGGGVGDWSAAGCLTVSREPARTVPEMAAAIQALDRSPERALVLGRAGQAAIAAQFAQAPLMERLIALYRSIAA